MIDWRRRFERYWLEDEEDWMRRQKNKTEPSAGKPAGWKEGNLELWWADDVEWVKGALYGAVGDEKSVERLKEILKIRGAW